MESKYVIMIIGVLTFLIIVVYGFYWTGKVADTKITEELITDINEKLTDETLKFSEKEFLHYLELAEECEDGKIALDTLGVPLPIFRQILYNIGLTNLICEESDIKTIRKGCISIMEIMGEGEFGDNVKQWRQWFDEGEEKK